MAARKSPSPSRDRAASAHDAGDAHEDAPARRSGRYDHLKPQVRRAYETTESSIRSLAETFGIATETTIRKWRDVEGWTKDIDKIRARLVTQAMAMGGPPDTPVVVTIEAVTSRTYDRPTSAPEPPIGDPAPAPSRRTKPDPAPARTEPDPDPTPAPADEPAQATRTADGIPILDGKEWPWGFGVYLPPKGFTAGPEQSIDAGKLRDGPDGARAARRAARKAEKIAPPVEETAGAHHGHHGEAGVCEAEPCDDGKVRRGAHSAHHEVRTKPARRSAPHASVTAPLDRREAEAAIDIATARGLAEIQAATIRRHSHMADRLLETATSMLALAQVAMLPLPPDASDEDIEYQQRAIQRLTAVNGDKDTLAGIVKAASAIAQTAVLIQRKSLGMEAAIAADIIQPSREIKGERNPLSHLPLETLASLRDYVMRKTRERPTGKVLKGIETREDAEGVRIDGTPIPPDPPEDEDDADGE